MANHQSIGATWYANGNWQEITVSQQHGDMRNISLYHKKITSKTSEKRKDTGGKLKIIQDPISEMGGNTIGWKPQIETDVKIIVTCHQQTWEFREHIWGHVISLSKLQVAPIVHPPIFWVENRGLPHGRASEACFSLGVR